MNEVINLVLGAFLLLQAGTVNEKVGDWSQVNRYLKARFVARFHTFSLDYTSDGPYSEFRVYLELSNTVPHNGTAQIKVNIDTTRDITYRVVDQDGKEILPRPTFRSTVHPGILHLLIPADSSIRFPVTVNGGGVLADQTSLDVMQQHRNPPGGIWRFDASKPAEYQLAGALRIERPPNATDVSQWYGEIMIPPVTLVIPGR